MRWIWIDWIELKNRYGKRCNVCRERGVRRSDGEDGIGWDVIRWDGMQRDGMGWGGTDFWGLAWDGVGWDEKRWGEMGNTIEKPNRTEKPNVLEKPNRPNHCCNISIIWDKIE